MIGEVVTLHPSMWVPDYANRLLRVTVEEIAEKGLQVLIHRGTGLTPTRWFVPWHSISYIEFQ